MQLTKEQIEFLDRVCFERYKWTLNSEGKVDVDGNVIMIAMNLVKIPVKFGRVSESFDCSRNKLTSLEGCPDWVGGSFNCFNNHLTSLEGCPDYVGGEFHCSWNSLTSLEGCPDEVGLGFYFYKNPLRDYFKNIKEEDFKFWREGKLHWTDIIREYPFLINIAKNYVEKERFIDLIKKYPKTKLYLK
jgi:hypothetical protein